MPDYIKTGDVDPDGYIWRLDKRGEAVPTYVGKTDNERKLREAFREFWATNKGPKINRWERPDATTSRTPRPR